MASKKSQDPNITFTLKRDFGLSQHRLALPPEELDNPSKNGAKIDVPSEKKQRRKSGMFSLQSDKSATMQSKGSTGRYGGRMTRLMQTNYETKKHSHKPPRSAPSTPPLASRHANHGGKYSPDPGRPSPSLHSRLVKKEMLGSDGEKRGSLENLKQLYGLDKEHQNIGKSKTAMAYTCMISSIYYRHRRSYSLISYFKGYVMLTIVLKLTLMIILLKELKKGK